jgi:hypothetical protein
MKIILTCFLTVNPNKLFYDFVKKLPDIDKTYICIDDNKYNIPDYDGKVKIIKIDNDICQKNGFHSTLTSLNCVKNFTGKAGSRDKALYYFYKNNINYDYIWFIEQDVFIPTINTIKHINSKYPDQDLLCQQNNIIYNRQTNWHWQLVNRQLKDKILPPYSNSMICAIRCSKKLLKCIFNHALKYNELFLDETLFNTIALHNKLIVNPIKELNTILWRKSGGWEKSDITENNLYHPIKCIDEQYKLRNSLNENFLLNKRYLSKKKININFLKQIHYSTM